MADYNEEILEAIKANVDYLNDANINDIALFLEAVGESLYNGEVVEQVAAALRDMDSEGI
jgi:hypothetical protein